ncbi:MAG: dihydrodipicolinate synthase family protein [bacterium]|nr:dihydrodipicolinate synthase family protein [bacterium]
MNGDEIRQALTGPFASLRTPFCKDGSIDFGALRNYIDFCISAGSKTLMLTYGDSLFSVLTDKEVAEVTKIVSEHNAGRAMVVAADRAWWTGKAVDFAEYVRKIGADMLMVMPPDWAGSCTPETLAEHYAVVAGHIPVMIVTNVFISRGKEFGLKTLKRILEISGNVLAVKDDMCGEFARKMSLLVYDRLAVVSGGQKQNHLDLLPYGCDGYLSTFTTFKPEVTRAYWKAIQSHDLNAARNIISKFDIPYFDFVMKLRGGFDAGLHGALELFGIAKRWRRAPYYSLNDEEMEQLADFFRGLSLL